MIFCEIIHPVIYSTFSIGNEVDHFCVVLQPVLSQVPGFVINLERVSFMKQRTVKTTVFLSDLNGLPSSGCGWSIAMRVFRIGTIACTQSNIPPFSTYAAEAITFLFLEDGYNGTVQFWLDRIVDWRQIAKVEMTIVSATVFGKYQLSGIGSNMQDHVTYVVSNDGIGLYFCIIYQAVAFFDSVGCRFVFLCGDIIQSGWHGRINFSVIVQEGACNGLDSFCPIWIKGWQVRFGLNVLGFGSIG